MASSGERCDSQATRGNNRDPARLWGSAAQRAGRARRPVRAARLTLAVRPLVFGFVLIGNLAACAQPPELESYRMDDYRAPTPETVAGGIVLDTEAAHKLWASGN